MYGLEVAPNMILVKRYSLDVSLNQVIEPENSLSVSFLLMHSDLKEGLPDISDNTILLHPNS